MPQVGIQERAWCMEHYFSSCGTGRNGGPSLTSVATAFEVQLQRPAPPNKTSLYRVDMFQQTGSVGSRNTGHSGRPRSTKSNDKVVRVMEKVLQSPKKSFRRMSKGLHLETTAVWRMVKEIGARSYRIRALHELKAPDFAARMQYSGRTSGDVLLSGHVNKQNIRFLGWERLDEYHQRPLHSEKATAWAAVSSHCVIGQHFIQDENGANTTVIAAVYRDEVIIRFHADLHTFCEVNGLDFERQVFQQDGATAHVGRGSAFPYPPRSPDLTVCDAFLQKCFNPVPRTLKNLRTNIGSVVSGVTARQCATMVAQISTAWNT
ncbi:hypothetical protein PR048_009377 [Dryococelus australis]|uniref:Uncharacterized protein n=1 Tax=Dryococelus australis TaxID=614101 RepID=A0ABQ9HZQ0_9NEOP|nr:hypothetical protein PR048_009377 [Dryococelus australis]